MSDQGRRSGEPMDHGRGRRGLALAATVGMCLFVWAGPAAAHNAEDLPATNYRSAVVSLEPAPAGVSARVIEAGNRLELANRGDGEVVILGYDDEPMLRVGPSGVFENRRSPSVYTSASSPLAVPADADPASEPLWRRISGGAIARWHDHRADPAQAAKAGSASWTVPLRHEGGPVTLVGSLRYVPGPNPLPWFGAAALVLAATAAVAVLRPRRWRSVVATALGAAVVLDVVHNLGRYAASYDNLLNRLFEFFFPLLGWMAAAVALRRLARRPPELPDPAGYAGLVLFFMGGLDGIEALSNSQLPFAYAPVLARVAVAACLGVGGGLLVALVSSVAAPLPVHANASPDESAEGQAPRQDEAQPEVSPPRAPGAP